MAARKPKQPEDTTVRFTLEGKPFEIDPSDLSWGEVEEIEVYFDRSVDDVDWETGRGVMFLAYLARRRVEPAFSISAMKVLKASDLQIDDEPRPTEPEPKNAGTPS